MTDLLNELARRRAVAEAHGGEAKVARQRRAGKQTARERVAMLMDAGSFIEIGGLATHAPTRVTPVKDKHTPADGVVTGFGRIDGRIAGVVAEDFTVLGGSLGLVNFEKKNRMIELARRDRVPLVWLFDGAGARTDEYIGEGLAPMHHFMNVARLSGTAPTIAAVLGPTAGDSSLLASMMEFIVMVKGEGMLAAGGPPLVAMGTGERVSKEELGGWEVHCRISGVADNAAEDEADAIRQLKRYLSFMPANAWAWPPRAEAAPAPDGAPETLRSLIPANRRRPYDMKKAVAAIFDRESFFELKPDHAGMMITGFARLEGRAVAVAANQPKVMAGAITAAAGHKLRRFIDLAAAYHLPVVFLTDTPGVMTGPKSEREGALRVGMAVASSFAFANTPLVTVVLHKAFGYGAAAMGGYGAEQSAVLAWPTADFNAIPLESGIRAAYKAEIAAAEDPDAFYDGLVREYGRLCGAWPAAEAMKIDDVIDPAETRPRLIEALDRAEMRRTEAPGPTMRHGVMP